MLALVFAAGSDGRVTEQALVLVLMFISMLVFPCLPYVHSHDLFGRKTCLAEHEIPIIQFCDRRGGYFLKIKLNLAIQGTS